MKYQKANCIGILQLNRKNIHSKVRGQKLKRVEIIVQYTGLVYVIKWSDNKSSSDVVRRRLKGGIVEPEETASTRQLHISTALNAPTAIEGLLGHC
jgi:hypothetical protein